jgi:23S rRNA (adenine1618-N6)-methyltransferase
MHSQNIHKNGYNLELICKNVPELNEYVIQAKSGKTSIDFSHPTAVYLLNKGLLITDYKITGWTLPDGYLCPPIPGRMDYLLHLKDLLPIKKLHLLDIGTGASLIYPILAASHLGWKVTASELSEASYAFAKAQLKNIRLSNSNITAIELRQQKDPACIFESIIKEGEYYDVSICNPPFFKSKEEAQKATTRKNKNLGITGQSSNFKGKPQELWCNGGEALFLKRMIKESKNFKTQVGYFTALVSQSDHLPKLIKQITKTGAKHRIIDMSQGNKKSRIISWNFQTAAK